jgi:predicted nucleotidyltransferase
MGESDLPNGWKDSVIAWAQRTDAVRELWSFGSRGPKGGARSDSDVDLGVVLMPQDGAHDWALGNYVSLGDEWRADLEAIVQRHVSLVPMIAGDEGDEVIRSTGVCLWRR